jgi:hypothetical protein
MVATLERLTESAPQPNFEPTADRPDGRSIFMDSRIFYWEHYDLLPEKYGVVAHLGGYSQGNHKTHTVIFSAESETEELVWQHTVATRDEGRTTRQLHVKNDGTLSGWSVSFDHQGQMGKLHEFATPDCLKDWVRIRKLIDSHKAREDAIQLRAQKESSVEALALFALKRAKLGELAFRGDFEKRQKALKKFGFTTLGLLQSPNPTQAKQLELFHDVGVRKQT